MSRHTVLLPSNMPSHDPTQDGAIDSVLIVCGFDRHPYKHLFCNVSNARRPDAVDKPDWSSILDDEYCRVATADGFDIRLSEWGITLPEHVKAALQEDWRNADMKRVVVWPQITSQARED